MEENLQTGMIVHGLNGFTQDNHKSKQDIITTITDEKLIFNLDSGCDYKLNDCIGEKIKIKNMLCKIIEKTLEEPIINEQTGEIKDKEYKMITIIIGEDNKSYITASKIFFFQFKKLCQLYGNNIIGTEIKIKNVEVKNSANKALGFELV